MANDSMNVGIFITDLLEKERIDDTDILLVEDLENTKKVLFRNFRISLISDKEAPANYRIYSSQKVHQLIDEIRDSVSDGIGGMEEDIQNLIKDKVSHIELDAAIAEIDAKKLDKVYLDPVIQELENTRKKSVPITGQDLAYGNEDEKIHLKHLGADILDAMTGKTPITPPSVPTGGWRGDDLADGSISARKLTKDYTYRGSYPEGNLNRLVESGVYEVAATVEGVPHYGEDMDETRLLEVIRYGTDGKYIIQRVYYKEYSSEVRPYFERKGLFQKLSILDFVAHFEISEVNKVESDLLGDRYNNRGKLSEGDLFLDTKSDGNYLCESTVKNLPTADKYLVNVRTFDNRKEYEAKRADINGCITYSCYEYYDSNHALIRTDWFNSTNVSKSKFDGKAIHIFGDGISYGLGSTDILHTAYPSILNKKYGYRVFNHALSDATAGNYGDDIFKQSSLLTQIDTATGLTVEDEIYVLIFIGAEDYRSGMAPIGNDDNENDTTFKGSLNLAIKKLLTKAPSAKVMFVSPIFRSSTEPGDDLDCDTNLVNDKYLRDFANAMSDIGKVNHIPCLDLFDECMINKYNSKIYLNKDGVYPSDKGHAMIAEKIHDGMCKFY
nr:MAG TPA: GDSL like Lipase Acylhydrolase [Caudoviricetes sp.]